MILVESSHRPTDLPEDERKKLHEDLTKMMGEFASCYDKLIEKIEGLKSLEHCDELLRQTYSESFKGKGEKILTMLDDKNTFNSEMQNCTMGGLAPSDGMTDAQRRADWGDYGD